MTLGDQPSGGGQMDINAISRLCVSKGLSPDMLQDCAEQFGADSPPVMGCLLALVREAHGDPGICVRRAPNGSWVVIHTKPPKGGGIPGNGDTEAEALVAALEVTP